VKRPLAAVFVLLLAILLSRQTGIEAAPEPSSIQFRDVTQRAGIRFLHNNGAFGKKFLPETMGPGVAFIDYDNDGWPDTFLRAISRSTRRRSYTTTIMTARSRT
jgi:hypothetical protein